MHFLLLFDLPSLLFVLSSLMIGFIVGGRNLQQSISLSRAISVPIGACGTLIGFIRILTSLADPSSLGPAFTVALLPSIYGLLLSVFLDAISSRMDSAPEASSQILQGNMIAGCVLSLMFPILVITLDAPLTAFIDFSSVILIFLGAPLLSYFTERTVNARIKALGKYSIIMSLIAILCSASLLPSIWSDPTEIGPVMAVGLLSLLYGGVLYTLSQVLHHSLYRKSFSYSLQGSSVYLLSTLFIGVSFFLPLMHSFT